MTKRLHNIIRLVPVAMCLTPGITLSASGMLPDLTEKVDTRVGTSAAVTGNAGVFGKGSEEHGQTIPAVGIPHGMNMWTPQTRDTELKCIAPYYYEDPEIQGFRNSHWINGGCTQDYGSMTLHPLSGTLRTSPESRATQIDKSTETAHPDYYSVYLPEEGITVELTGLSRSAIFRLTYDRDGIGHIVVNPNSDEGEGYIEVDTIRREIRGYNPVHRIYQGWGEPAGFKGWFAVRLPEDIEITGYGTFKGDSISQSSFSAGSAGGIGGYFTFRVLEDIPVEVKAGSSFTSMENAIRNLDIEIPHWDFDIIRKESAEAWNTRLGKIIVEGGSDDDKAKFYGSLYRASLLPRVISDCDGSYPAFSKGSPVMRTKPGRDYYDDFSMWDIYRSQLPLITLLDPRRMSDMVNSLVLKAQQGGWMPIFPCWNSYTAAMIGDHCAAAIADAAVKGIEGFDLAEAYRYLRRNAFESPDSYEEYSDGMGRRALSSYLEYGYIPLEDNVKEAFHTCEQTSRTLEYAYDDFALSRIAEILGLEEDKAELLRRSRNYRNVIDPDLGYANGRHRDGSFASSTDPFSFNSAITEGAPCHYTWYVPHDPEGLVDILGGKEKFEAKLDSMFTNGRYWHGNEPCHQVAYMFDLVDRHDKTARWVRHILDTEYLNVPGGLSGNDDAGQMSSWFVFSAMGFYPMTPSTPYYYLGVPLFDEIRIKLDNGKTFTVKRGKNDAANESSINGESATGHRISHTDIMSGAILEIPGGH